MKRSALFHHQEHLGATFVEYHGWQLADAFPTLESAEVAGVRNRVGLADISHRCKFETTAQPAQHWWRLRAGRYLMIGEPPLTPPPDATDVTSVYSNLLLAGPRSKDVLGKLSSLNTAEECLPNLSCAQTNVAHVHTIVLREDMGQLTAFYLLMTRDYAESVWDSVVHAGREFQLCPFGLKALQSLRS